MSNAALLTARSYLAEDGELAPFISKGQRRLLRELMLGEEGPSFVKLITELHERIEAMPTTKQGDGTVHLHYFLGATDAWITEKDIGDGTDDKGQHQAFGQISLNGDYPELGYVSIAELIANGVEIDLHWTPKQLSEVA